ncbi:MAG TPA: thrombospondin type 3 repeat-containing protein, partial [Verrucomicrobiae bacterium]
TNGISELWELAFFGSVATNHPPNTDTDGDGLTDYAEFIAGTNPTNAASRFYFVSAALGTNSTPVIAWTAVTNRLYQVNASTDLFNWFPETPWLQMSNGATMTFTETNPAGSAEFYRVQVRP